MPCLRLGHAALCAPAAPGWHRVLRAGVAPGCGAAFGGHRAVPRRGGAFRAVGPVGAASRQGGVGRGGFERGR